MTAAQSFSGRSSYTVCTVFAWQLHFLTETLMADEKKSLSTMTIEELTVLQEIYDTDRNGTLCKDEIAAIVKSYNEKTITDARIISILKRYDTNEDGTIDDTEGEHFNHELDINETSARYAGYTSGLARLFRYLAFTSDFGEALRPVVSRTIVNSSYAVAIGYCFADVGWDAYKLRRRGYVTEKNEPMSMTQCIVERATFQAVASMIIPTAVIHTSVDVARKVATKYGRYQKWGPSLVGLSIIPLLPMYLDHPVEHALEWGFANYGPWAKKGGKTHED